jgi:hypothetical protein
MYLMVEDSDNCQGAERMFAHLGDPKPVREVHISSPAGHARWWSVTGVDENGAFIPAFGIRVDDSAAGTAWLVGGGTWGLRFRALDDNAPWSLADKNQWGAPFLVLDESGTDLRF